MRLFPSLRKINNTKKMILLMYFSMSTLFAEFMFLRLDFSTPEGVTKLINLILLFLTVCVFAGGIYRSHRKCLIWQQG